MASNLGYISVAIWDDKSEIAKLTSKYQRTGIIEKYIVPVVEYLFFIDVVSSQSCDLESRTAVASRKSAMSLNMKSRGGEMALIMNMELEIEQENDEDDNSSISSNSEEVTKWVLMMKYRKCQW